MTEAALQILLILAFLAIGLIAVAFPLYAIAVNFLPQEKWEGEKERKKRIERLKCSIKEQTSKLEGISEDNERADRLTKEIEKYKTELETTELKSRYLTAQGAVGLPVIFLTAGLLLTVVGIVFYYQDSQTQSINALNSVVILIIISAFCIAIASFRMYKTLLAVESASLRTERTIDFEVGFGHELSPSIEIVLGKSSKVAVEARTHDSDVENRVLVVKLPKELGLIERHETSDRIFGSDDKIDMITIFNQFVPKGYFLGPVLLLDPTRVGEYKIIAKVCGKGLVWIEKELSINVKEISPIPEATSKRAKT